MKYSYRKTMELLNELNIQTMLIPENKKNSTLKETIQNKINDAAECFALVKAEKKNMKKEVVNG